MEREYIPLSVPNLTGNELKYLANAIKTGWISTNGSYVNKFEKNVAEYVQVKGAISCQSGTSGLHLAMLVLGIKKGDMVIAPTLTFIAAINPITYVGAVPVFMDCDDSLCMDPIKLRKYCVEECDFINGRLIDRSTGKYVKAILVVHIFGNMADMEAIMQVAEQFNLLVVEDATEAMGTYYLEGKYKEKYAGTIGNVGVYSFNANKIMTTGGGGMLVSNNEEYLKHAKHLSTQAKRDEINYLHDEIGYNYRMTNMQAALGIAQLEQLEEFVAIKEENYHYYKEKIKQKLNIDLLAFRDGIRSNHWFYSMSVSKLNGNRTKVFDYLQDKNIQTRPIWGLISEQLPYQEAKTFKIELAKYFWANILNLPCSTNLAKNDIDYIVEIMEKYMKVRG
jgi:Predicted pyridoxal phosphate-dependent enzyme apparently involved in regulation of cell wall biogenesis